jgi:AraC-like DNA-binding protein
MLGKMRQNPRLNVVLKPVGAGASRVAPSADLVGLVDWIWTSWWDFSEPRVVEVLSDASFHLVFEPRGATNVVGVVTRKFTRRLDGVGRVVGVRFRPGAFRCLARSRAAVFTDGRVPIVEAMGCDALAAEKRIFAATSDERRAAVVEDFLRARRPVLDDDARLVQAMVDAIESDRELMRVEDLATRFSIGVRKLQRLFAEYIGVGPKWVLRRARLLEAAERLQNGEKASLAELAAELGYFDQAHLAREFRAVVGRAPVEVRRKMG